MKRPMVMVALLHGAGILLASRVVPGCPVPLLLLASLGAIVLGVCAPRHGSWLLAAALLLAGAANQSRHQAVLSPLDLRPLLGEDPHLATVRGRLAETPYARRHRQPDTLTDRWRTVGELEVEAIRLQDGSWQPATGHLLTQTPGRLGPGYFTGARVELTGVIAPPARPAVPAQFDYHAHLAGLGIHYQLAIGSTNDWPAAARGGPAHTQPLADRFMDWARHTLARGLGEEDAILQLLWAMTLGWKSALSQDLAEPFMRSGTMHVFAISGLHIALIAALLVAVLRALRTPRRVCGALVIPLLWAYTGVTGWQASAIRSTIMSSVLLAGWTFQRPSDLLNSLAAAAMLILVWDPQQLFQASFQLSFTVVLSLALIQPRLEAMRPGWLAPDPLLPAALRPRWHRWLRLPAEQVLGSLEVSLAAWLGSLPVLAHYFHLLSLISLPANLLAVPLSSAALACNMGSLATGEICPGASVLLNHCAWLCMWLMVHVSDVAAQFPGGVWNIQPPGWPTFLLYYCSLAAWLWPGPGLMPGPHSTPGPAQAPAPPTPAPSPPRSWALQWPWLQPALPRRLPSDPTDGSRGLRLPVLLLLAAVWLAAHVEGHASHQLTVLSLSGGEAIHHRPPRWQSELLVDCGNPRDEEFILKPFLRAEGINRLGVFVLTHGDTHNIGGAGLLAGQFHPRSILHNAASFRSKIYREQLAILRRDAAPAAAGSLQAIAAGDRVGPWTVLHPAASSRFTRADDAALVLFGTLGGCRVLLLSDLGEAGQNRLLSIHPPEQLRADIVVTGLPSTSKPLVDPLLALVSPSLIIVTDSLYPATQRTPVATRDRLAAWEVPVLYTREIGAVQLSLRPGRWEVRAGDGLRLYLHPREPRRQPGS